MRIEKLSQRMTRISCSDKDKDKRTGISNQIHTNKSRTMLERFLDYSVNKLTENTIDRIKKEKGQKE